MTVSISVIPSNRRGVWYVRARPSSAIWRAERPTTGWPITPTAPSLGESVPEISEITVDLPAPFGPISAVT
ncbi:unannotated protein [freshwater metagenome]|uniref:Unannotated protein n=1 Tax=freshwater metagenome TaxID=449393 RepID=A0A6J7E5F7_9ZZZZ